LIRAHDLTQKQNDAEEWVTMTKRISAVSGSKVAECRSDFRGPIVDWH